MGEFFASDCQENAMFFSLGQLDVADEVGVGCFFTFWSGLFGDKEGWVSAFNSFGRETVFTHTLCQAKKIVGGGNIPSYFIRDRTESVERGLGASIGVNHCGRGGKNGARLLVDSVSGRISMWS